jgi:hypothetical protein
MQGGSVALDLDAHFSDQLRRLRHRTRHRQRGDHN